jgi:hypothetical protein
MRYWGDIELPDEDELCELEALADIRREIDAAPQPDRERDEKSCRLSDKKEKGTRLCALLLFDHCLCN